uniref:Uncharacterized protein n=1 Tax=Quercus lobata TaxID=97700 RepID=A0A7N2L1E3_QUELO
MGGKLGKQSRLWLVEDLLHVLENGMATEAIQAIVVKGRKKDFNLEEFSEGFSKMSNLRLLTIGRMNALNDQRHLAFPNNLGYVFYPPTFPSSHHFSILLLFHLFNQTNP